jgi:hypothetical protein
MHWKNPIDCFDFDDQLILDHDVHPIAAIDPDIFVDDRECDLTPIADPGLLQLKTSAFFVGRLEKPWGKVMVHVDAQADYPLA